MPLTGTADFNLAVNHNDGDLTAIKFSLNRDPVALWAQTRCLYMDNGHTTYNTMKFQAQVICGTNAQYTTAQAVDLIPAAARYVEEFIDSTSKVFTFSAFTSTG